MAKHQALSARSRRTRALIGGVMAGGVLALAAPAGLAFADTMGDTVGRPSFDAGNPAPGVRVAQSVGDATFNNDPDSPLGQAINRSPLGDAYHKAFGTRGNFDKDGKYVAGTGSNGYIKGALNAPRGMVIGNAIPLKECNIKVSSGSLIPVGIQGGKC